MMLVILIGGLFVLSGVGGVVVGHAAALAGWWLIVVGLALAGLAGWWLNADSRT
jgi:hypothetical protein